MRQIRDEGPSDAYSPAREGWYYAVVRSCEEKRSQRGEVYFNLELVDAATGHHLAWEVCMLQGKGLRFGTAKLALFGAARWNETKEVWDVDDPPEVVGLRARVYLRHETSEWEGTQRTRCQISLSRTRSSFGAGEGGAGGSVDEPEATDGSVEA